VRFGWATMRSSLQQDIDAFGSKLKRRKVLW
jgi:hypothetical protein